jgi:hypothetical protein
VIALLGALWLDGKLMNTLQNVRSNHFATPRSQLGIGLFGILFVLVVLAFVGVVGMQAFPTVLEYTKIQKALERAVKAGSDQATIRDAYDKATVIDDIKSVEGKDLQFKKLSNDRFEVSFAYEKEIPIYKPVYLLIKYSGTAK